MSEIFCTIMILMFHMPAQNIVTALLKNTKMTTLLSIFSKIRADFCSVFPHIQTEYRNLQCKSSFPVRIQEIFSQWLQFCLQFAKNFCNIHILDNLKHKKWKWSSKLLKCKFTLLFLYFYIFFVSTSLCLAFKQHSCINDLQAT